MSVDVRLYRFCAVCVFTRHASRGRGALCGVGYAVLGCVYLVRGSWCSGLSRVSLAMESVREETMDTKKLIGAMVAAFVILFATGFLVHSVLLGPTYSKLHDAGFSFCPDDSKRPKLWCIWISYALY